MRLPALLATLLLIRSEALADCPPDCVPGGGSVATDCFVAWSGIPGTAVTCTDGDPSCDTDGKVDGVCTLGIQGCINVPGLGTCTPSGLSRVPTVKPLKDTMAQELTGVLDMLDPATYGCTPPGLGLPVGFALTGIKPGTSRLSVTAVSGSRRDRDRLRLTCLPGPPVQPSFARDVQPILTARCAIVSCHSGQVPSGGQNLEAGHAYAQSVNTPATTGSLPRVVPGNIKRSQMAHRILGLGLPRGGAFMPLGCPGFPAAGGCLTKPEIFTILSWIAEGAPDN